MSSFIGEGIGGGGWWTVLVCDWLAIRAAVQADWNAHDQKEQHGRPQTRQQPSEDMLRVQYSAVLS